MFDNILRELRRLERPTELSVRIEPDPQGYLDRECPSAECRYGFKVLAEDWRERFKDQAVFCPRCGHNAPAKSWATTAQVEHAKRVALQHVQGRIEDALRRDAQAFGAKTFPTGLIDLKISMQYAGPSISLLPLPTPTREELEQKSQCPACGARYAILGSGFFCPCCGRNSVEEMFDSTLEKILASLTKLDSIRRAVADVSDKDHADRLCMSIVESSLYDCVSAFQALCEGLYSKISIGSPPPRNAFQRLDQGSELWERALSMPYSSVLSPTEIAHLRIYFQRRHLLAHTQGIVDEEYVTKSGDTTYAVGQRIVVSAVEVNSLAALIRKLVDAIRRKAAVVSQSKGTAP